MIQTWVSFIFTATVVTASEVSECKHARPLGSHSLIQTRSSISISKCDAKEVKSKCEADGWTRCQNAQFCVSCGASEELYDICVDQREECRSCMGGADNKKKSQTFYCDGTESSPNQVFEDCRSNNCHSDTAIRSLLVGCDKRYWEKQGKKATCAISSLEIQSLDYQTKWNHRCSSGFPHYCPSVDHCIAEGCVSETRTAMGGRLVFSRTQDCECEKRCPDHDTACTDRDYCEEKCWYVKSTLKLANCPLPKECHEKEQKCTTSGRCLHLDYCIHCGYSYQIRDICSEKRDERECDSKCPADDDKMTTLCENRVYCASRCDFVPSSFKLPTCPEPPSMTQPPPLTSRPPLSQTMQPPPPPLAKPPPPTKPPPSNVKPSESEQPQDQPHGSSAAQP